MISSSPAKTPATQPVLNALISNVTADIKSNTTSIASGHGNTKDNILSAFALYKVDRKDAKLAIARAVVAMSSDLVRERQR